MHRVEQLVRHKRLVTVTPEMSVLAVAEVMTASGVGAVPVVDGERLVGMFSERDLMARVVVPGRDPGATPVSAVMTRDVVTAAPSDGIDPCVEKMQAQRCRRLPVVDGGRLVAVLSMRDLLRDEIDEREEEIRHLRAYLHQQGPR